MQVKRVQWYIPYSPSPSVLCLLYASCYTPPVCVCVLPHAYKCVGVFLNANGATVVDNIACCWMNPQLILLADRCRHHRKSCTIRLGEIEIPSEFKKCYCEAESFPPSLTALSWETGGALSTPQSLTYPQRSSSVFFSSFFFFKFSTGFLQDRRLVVCVPFVSNPYAVHQTET